MIKITQNEVNMKTAGMMKTCPFCGNYPAAKPWHGGCAKKIIIVCESDVCDVAPSCTGETPEDALSVWNHRAKGVK